MGSSRGSSGLGSPVEFFADLILKNIFTVRLQTNLLRSTNRVKGYGQAEGAKLRPLLSSEVSSRLSGNVDRLNIFLFWGVSLFSFCLLLPPCLPLLLDFYFVQVGEFLLKKKGLNRHFYARWVNLQCFRGLVYSTGYRSGDLGVCYLWGKGVYSISQK